MRSKKIVKLARSSAVALISLGIALVVANIWIEVMGRRHIAHTQPSTQRPYVIVLGASVFGEKLSGALRDRMTKAIELHKAGLVRKILLSGDGTGEWYNETAAMTRYALKKGVPLESIYVDQEGYSTTASLVRANRFFNITSAYIVTQDYHLPRALWLANLFSIESEGIAANTSPNGIGPSIREIFVRFKDFFSAPIAVVASQFFGFTWQL